VNAFAPAAFLYITAISVIDLMASNV
jgi:hypothetical protein